MKSFVPGAPGDDKKLICLLSLFFYRFSCTLYNHLLWKIEGPFLMKISEIFVPFFVLFFLQGQLLLQQLYLFRLFRASLSPFFKDIYFIPDNPVLKKIKSIIESSHVVITTTKDFKSEMGCLVKGIAGENEDVQKFALMKLCNLLKTNSSYLVDILTMADTMDPVIKQIIDVLLKSCKGLF